MPTLSRSSRRFGYLALLMCLVLPMVLVACEILEIVQPETAELGAEIEVQLSIGNFTDDANPHKGFVSVLVPEDWAFVSGTYAGNGGTGDMTETTDWADSTEKVLPAPDGMKWIAAISDVGYTVASTDVYDATLKLQVGQTAGEFALGYFISTDAIAAKDVDLDPDGGVNADTTLNQRITVTGGTASEGGPEGEFVLYPNSPNPVRASTAIRYSLARAAAVRVSVFDVTGREVASFDRGTQSAGEHSVDFTPAELASGTYLYQLEIDGDVVQTRRMLLVR